MLELKHREKDVRLIKCEECMNVYEHVFLGAVWKRDASAVVRAQRISWEEKCTQ